MENLDKEVQSAQTVVVIKDERKKNGIGVAGFVLALVGFFFSWVPVFGWIAWILGTVFSFIGVFKQPKGLSIAGLVISFIGLIILIFAAAAIATMI
jgi:hypothetical protein